MRLLICLFISALMHFAALTLPFGFNFKETGDGDKPKTNGEGGKDKYKGMNIAAILEKNRPTEVALVERKDPEPEIVVKRVKKKKAIDAEVECPGKWFGGIGVTVNMTGLVIRVHRGYPADLAGLMDGDMILSTEGAEILGPPGTTLNTTIDRKGKILKITIVRGKICY